MAQTRVFSWKITDNKYGYLYIPGKRGNELISDRITNEEILSQIAGVVGEMDISEYENKFNELNDLIYSKYRVRIPGTASEYCGDYSKNYIILGGKDGGTKQINEKELNNYIIRNVENAIENKLNQAKKELKLEVNNVKDITISKVNETVDNAINEIDSIKVEIDSGNTILSEKLIAAQTHIERAADLFDFNSTGVNKENLQNAINNSSSAVTRLGFVERDINSLNERSDNFAHDINDLNREVETLNSGVSYVVTTVREQGETLRNVTGSVNSLMSRMAAVEEEVYEDSQIDDNEPLSKSMPSRSAIQDNDIAGIANVTDNEDGTYNAKFTVGNETFHIKLYGFGNYIKEDEFEDGLVLARNGFRYMDKSGSQISIVNGNITLSNANGTGKLEIKDDGLYINGKKKA